MKPRSKSFDSKADAEKWARELEARLIASVQLWTRRSSRPRHLARPWSVISASGTARRVSTRGGAPLRELGLFVFSLSGFGGHICTPLPDNLKFDFTEWTRVDHARLPSCERYLPFAWRYVHRTFPIAS